MERDFLERALFDHFYTGEIVLTPLIVALILWSTK